VPRPTLTERRRAQTRHEIAKSALALFAQDGYENVSVDVIAEECGISLRTFYRYFSSKDEVLSPIITGGTGRFAEQVVQRPAEEDLATAVQRAFEEMSERRAPEDIRTLIGVLTNVPVLRARWLGDLRAIEHALVPVIRQRTIAPLSDEQAQLTAAVIVTGLRVTLELSTRAGSAEPLSDPLGHALRYLRDGANL
jgi:AcrR family transcriptional regulator